MNALAARQISTTTWNIDPVHSAAEFKVSPMMISNLKGQFARRDGVDVDVVWIESSESPADLDAVLAAPSPTQQMAEAARQAEPLRDVRLRAMHASPVELAPLPRRAGEAQGAEVEA